MRNPRNLPRRCEGIAFAYISVNTSPPGPEARKNMMIVVTAVMSSNDSDVENRVISARTANAMVLVIAENLYSGIFRGLCCTHADTGSCGKYHPIESNELTKPMSALEFVRCERKPGSTVVFDRNDNARL